jgi:uncharacterized membrane protein
MSEPKQLLSNLRSSFWYVPSLVVADSIIIALALIEADAVWGDRWSAQVPRLFGIGAEGARQMLSTLAGSMMTIMGITFSMTLVALSLASTQYTSRILRNFMRSGITQGTLGIFAGIFAYCLIVLRSIRSGEAAFVPSLAVFFAFVLALAGVVVLVYFIHHIASSIQASSILASVAKETMAAIERLFPEKLGQGPDKVGGKESQPVLPLLDERTWYPVPSEVSGYVQSVDDDALLRLAQDRKTIVRMEHGVGAFVVQDTPLASLALAYPPDRETISALHGIYDISSHRTIEQDPAFGIRQIVDIALRALSPGINDTSTAVMCVDYLTAILARLACRRFPLSYRYEGETLRVIAIVPTFEGLLAEAFDQIRGSAAGNVAIMMCVLGALETISSLTISPSHLRALGEQVQCIAELADRTIESAHDRMRIETRLGRVRQAIESGAAVCAQVENNEQA